MLPKIVKIMKLEGFQYNTPLELNMGYYTINILPESCDPMNILTELGKFRYNENLCFR